MYLRKPQRMVPVPVPIISYNEMSHGDNNDIVYLQQYNYHNCKAPPMPSMPRTVREMRLWDIEFGIQHAYA